MKKRSKALTALLCAAMVLTAGCGGKADTKEEKADTGSGTEKEEQTSESDEYLALIQEAFEQHKAEGIHGEKEESTGKRADGSSETSTWTSTMNTDQQQYMTKSIWADGSDYVAYYTKEGENEYYYHAITTYYDDSAEGVKTYYKVLSTDQEYENFSYYLNNEKGKPYESTEYYDISNVNVTKEGEEELDGVKVQKFKVEYDSQWKDGEEKTRESVLAENEWTEEDVALFDGMSDAIDAYIEESNAQMKKDMDKIDKVTQTVYLASEDNKLIRTETESDYEDVDMPASEAYWDLANKLSYLKDLLSEGLGKDEAMGMVNEAYGDATAETMDSEDAAIVSYSSVITYVTGDACEPIEIPADAQEITWEQYENGEY